MKLSIPETARAVPLLKPATDAAGRTSRYFSMKDAERAIIVVHLDQGNASTVALQLKQAQAVAGTNAKNGPAVQVWAALDVSTTEVPARQTDGSSFTTDAGVKEKIVVFQVDAAALDTNNGFRCVAIATGASNVANITQATAYLVGGRYQSSAPPSALVD